MSRSKLCHTLCPPWACACQSLGPFACVVTSVPSKACLDLTTCENTYEVLVCSIHTFLYSVRYWYASLACFAPPIWLSLLLCIFASLHTCLHVHAWVCVSSILQYNGTMDTRSKPTFVLLGHHLLFDNMFVCLFMWFNVCLLPVCHLLIACLLACFPPTCSFACLLAYFFCHCMYTRGAWTLGVRVWPPRRKQKGQGCK